MVGAGCQEAAAPASIGNPTATGCSLLEWTDSAAVGGGIQGSIVPGAYCLMIYDIGNVVDSDDYSISVTRP